MTIYLLIILHTWAWLSWVVLLMVLSRVTHVATVVWWFNLIWTVQDGV